MLLVLLHFKFDCSPQNVLLDPNSTMALISRRIDFKEVDRRYVVNAF
jgi:hypothetical protein